MTDKVNLIWTEQCECNVDIAQLYQALVDLYYEFAPEFDDRFDYVETVVDWLNDNLKNYLEEFIDKIDPYRTINGDIGDENITALLDNEEFMDKFEEWLND